MDILGEAIAGLYSLIFFLPVACNYRNPTVAKIITGKK